MAFVELKKRTKRPVYSVFSYKCIVREHNEPIVTFKIPREFWAVDRVRLLVDVKTKKPCFKLKATKNKKQGWVVSPGRNVVITLSVPGLVLRTTEGFVEIADYKKQKDGLIFTFPDLNF